MVNLVNAKQSAARYEGIRLAEIGVSQTSTDQLTQAPDPTVRVVYRRNKYAPGGFPG